jgi:hypothetical protein
MYPIGGAQIRSPFWYEVLLLEAKGIDEVADGRH